MIAYNYKMVYSESTQKVKIKTICMPMVRSLALTKLHQTVIFRTILPLTLLKNSYYALSLVQTMYPPLTGSTYLLITYIQDYIIEGQLRSKLLTLYEYHKHYKNTVLLYALCTLVDLDIVLLLL